MPAVRPNVYVCDVCCEVPPAWRYPVPDMTSPVKLMDTHTGQVIEPFRIVGGVGLCDDCRGIVDKMGKGNPALPERLGARTVRLHPALRGVEAARRTFAKRGMASMWRRLLPLMPEPVPAVKGEGTLDGLMIDMGPVTGQPMPGHARGVEAN